MPLKIPAVDLSRVPREIRDIYEGKVEAQWPEPPPPIERDQYDFAPLIPPTSLTYTKVVRNAVAAMTHDEVEDLAKAILADRVPLYNVQKLAGMLRLWAFKGPAQAGPPGPA